MHIISCSEHPHKIMLQILWIWAQSDIMYISLNFKIYNSKFKWVRDDRTGNRAGYAG